MTTEEGKTLLKSCMEKCGCKEKSDNIIIFKCGNKLHANMYQKNEITAEVKRHEYKNSTQYLIKFLMHMEIYIAWKAENYKQKYTYICYKSTLEEMENGKLGNWYETSEDTNNKFCIFKGREGVMEFVRRKLINNQ